MKGDTKSFRATSFWVFSSFWISFSVCLKCVDNGFSWIKTQKHSIVIGIEDLEQLKSEIMHTVEGRTELFLFMWFSLLYWVDFDFAFYCSPAKTIRFPIFKMFGRTNNILSCFSNFSCRVEWILNFPFYRSSKQSSNFLLVHLRGKTIKIQVQHKEMWIWGKSEFARQSYFLRKADTTIHELEMFSVSFLILVKILWVWVCLDKITLDRVPDFI